MSESKEDKEPRRIVLRVTPEEFARLEDRLLEMRPRASWQEVGYALWMEWLAGHEPPEPRQPCPFPDLTPAEGRKLAIYLDVLRAYNTAGLEMVIEQLREARSR